MTAKERMAREARRGREARHPVSSDVGEKVDTMEQSGPGIEFEDRSDEDYRAAVLEVMAALDWVRQQRSRGNLPS